MREIKFRGKRIDNGEWVYGNLIYSKDAVKRYETIIIPQKGADGFTTDYASNGKNKESYGFDNWFCVIPETVGQFTGLKDKNGTEIYEGDVLEIYDKKGEKPISKAKVYWNNGYWDAKALGDNSFWSCYSGFVKNKVIGNIYENPELLGVKMNCKIAKKAIDDFNGHKIGGYELVEHFETITKALEKHIPMPVEKSNYKYKAVDVEINEIRHYDASRCPVCDKWLTKIYKYCPHCGQRIVENN